MERFPEEWLCSEPGCRREAVGHVSVEGKHAYLCDEHWSIYVGLRQGKLSCLKKKNKR